jgi:hypothetical protein
VAGGEGGHVQLRRRTEYVINRRLFASMDESPLLGFSDDPDRRPPR